MKNQILKDLKEKGIFLHDQFLDENEKINLKKDFESKNNYEFFELNNEKELEKISKTLFKFLQRDCIKNFLHEYFESDITYSSVLFTRSAPEIKRDDNINSSNGSILAFHNDDSGKQIKINILLSDLSEKSNGLEYAISSHKITNLDKKILNFFKFFGLFKNWNKHFLNYQKNKFKRKKVNFMSEDEIKSKYKVFKVFGKSGLVYIFDTNGFHRQASVQKENYFEQQRELITIYIDSKRINK